MDVPPWVREAQAFIDHEWTAHLHDTEHTRQPDWRLGPEVILYNSVGDVQIVHIDCRYCRIAAYTNRLREWYDNQPTCECDDCGP